MSALRQLQLIIVGATIGAIAGSVVLRTSDDLRPVGIAMAAGAILLGPTLALQRFVSQPVPRLAPAFSSLIGRVVVTVAAALSVVLMFHLLVAPDARSVPARPNAQATDASSARPVVPVEPALPQPVVRPPAATQPTSSTPRATVLPVSSPAATSPVSPFATPPASPQSPPPSVATAQPTTPQPTPVSSPPSIVPTLPPLPTLPIRLP